VRKLICLTFIVILIAVVVVPALIVKNHEKKDGSFSILKPDSESINISVFFHETGKIMELPLEAYIVGVLAAEMPADFEMEALKAQAVAARTYVVKKLTLNSNNEHPEAAVCTNPNHCQAWMSTDEMKSKWGLYKYISYKAKLEEAVDTTKGMVLSYQGRLIDPVYHSTSTGKTENSEDVWLNFIPYLRSVESPWDRQSPRFQERKAISVNQIDAILGTNLSARPVSAMLGTNPNIIRILETTSSDRVKKLYIDGKTIMGTEFRKALGLNSTRFMWELQGDKIVFTTIGYGHGVGMSQYGANGMAKEGATFEQILKHYYTGVEISMLEQ
jgi:stage II sporulation protein D